MTPETVANLIARPAASAPPAARTGDAAPASEAARERRAAIEALRERDRALRARQAAQIEAGRPWAGRAEISMHIGPDGRRYAVAGSVRFDVSPAAAGPAATAAKMRAVAAAALVGPVPGPADRRAAAEARARLSEALEALSATAEESARPKLSVRL